MPSTSRPQANLMAMVAHDSEAAKRTGIPQSTAKEFNQADKGRGIIGKGKKKAKKKTKKKEKPTFRRY